MKTAVVLAKNEEKSIKTCLLSLKGFEEIIVIDDNSSDKTREIAKKLGVRVYKRKLNNDFSNQRNFGLKKAKGDWIFFLDADEKIDNKLKREIFKAIRDPQTNSGFSFKRKDTFLGKELKFGETASLRLTRLGKKNSGFWTGKVHEVWKVKGKIGKLYNPIIHQRHIGVSGFIKRINFYSSLRARELYEKGVKTNAFLIIIYPLAKFFLNFFVKLGILDGKQGFIMATLMSAHSFLVRSKLYLLWKNKGVEDPPIPPLKKLYKQYG